MENLHELAPADLTERLLAVAREARLAMQSDDPLVLHDLLVAVRRGADAAEGEQAELLQIAEAFLRALARSDLGRTEVALRRFVVREPEGAEELLVPLASGTSVSSEEAHRLAGESFEGLVEVGALRVLPGDRVDLRPALRGLARDLVEPLALRMWRRVRDARAVVSQPTFKRSEERAAFLSGQLGITRDQAMRHLRTAPLSDSTSVLRNYPASKPGRAALPLHTKWTSQRVSRSDRAAELGESLSWNLAIEGVVVELQADGLAVEAPDSKGMAAE